MLIHVIEARYLSDHKIKLTFDNNRSGVVDLRDMLVGPVFEPLKNVHYFKSFKLNREMGTISWDNGADFAPEFLYEKAGLSKSS